MNTINVNGITYYAKPPVSDNEEKLRNLLKEIEWYVNDMVSNGRELQEDFNKQGLTIGAVEAEGFLRASIQINEWIIGMTKSSD